MSDMKYKFDENDSDLLCSHWLLIVIILIASVYLLGRRKGLVINNKGISHVSVSRRRRIFKDDPIAPRRPPQLIIYEHLDSENKINHLDLNSGTTTIMPGNNRRISSSLKNGGDQMKYSAIQHPVGKIIMMPDESTIPVATAPKHIPFPNIPMDSELMFEIIMFVFTSAAAALQFLQIYRSVWWLPHAYTHHTMNFYLIDIHVIIFILVIFARRLIYMLGSLILKRFSPQPFVYQLYQIFLLIGIFSELTLCGYNIFQSHSLVNIFYLCYPISVYLILFGLTISPFFELVENEEFGASSKPLHSCTSNSTEIRLEVEHLKTDFNNRIKQVLFSSVLNAYYAGFIPCCFAQSFVYYDTYSSTLHLIFVGVGCFTMYAGHILPMRYCDVLHRSALHLGAWSRVEPRTHIPVPYHWTSDTLWPYGSLVRHCRDLYKAQGTAYNAAEPGNMTHSRFHSMFKNPSVAASGLVGLQLSLVLVQIALLIRTSHWHQIISLTLLLFVNYYTLFKLGRDYLIALKLYKAEQTIHEKYTNH